MYSAPGVSEQTDEATGGWPIRRPVVLDIVELGHRLVFAVIAEGDESLKQGDLLVYRG